MSKPGAETGAGPEREREKSAPAFMLAGEKERAARRLDCALPYGRERARAAGARWRSAVRSWARASFGHGRGGVRAPDAILRAGPRASSVPGVRASRRPPRRCARDAAGRAGSRRLRVRTRGWAAQFAAHDGHGLHSGGRAAPTMRPTSPRLLPPCFRRAATSRQVCALPRETGAALANRVQLPRSQSLERSTGSSPRHASSRATT